MGNANSGASGSSTSQRDRHKSGDSNPPLSPGVKDGQAFTFEKRNSLSKPGSGGRNQKIVLQNSHEDDEPPNFAKPTSSSVVIPTDTRRRSNTVSEGTKIPGTSGPDLQEDTSKILPTVFKWDGGGKQVYISGSFTNWQTIPMVKSHGDFVAIVDLPEGEHAYKYYIDGEWKCDPAEPIKENAVGAKNNVISVKKTDFEVFDALDMDSISSASNTQHISGSPPGSTYNQDIPSYKPWEKMPGPPILPPHLLQVILNKDTPLSCEPTLLPQPNHVMLNHLYALSIKDGVMVLSATHRYRKKYVTTLLYKPI